MHRAHSIRYLLLSTTFALGATLSEHSHAANANFQNFLFAACANASGDLAVRCSESNGGDVSGDSESSLNPSQTLVQNTNALQEAVAAVRALRDGDDTTTIEQASFGRWSVVISGDQSRLIRDPGGDNSRGYTLEMDALRLALDYRYSDRLVAGALLIDGRSESRLTPYIPSGQFPAYNPDRSGASKSTSTSLGAYSHLFLSPHWSLDGLLLYTLSDYDIFRDAVFQVSARNNDSPVSTRASTEGRQLALGGGLHYDNHHGSLNYGGFVRADYQDSTIDSYRERGGNGLALHVSDADADQWLVSGGISAAYTILTDVAVIQPHAFIEHQRKTGASPASRVVRLLEDSGDNTLTLTGSKEDSTLNRVGAGIGMVWPNGVNGFATFSRDYSSKGVYRTQFTAGLRIEF